MRLLWQQHAHEEDWAFLLIDTRNALNEYNHTAMLRAVLHKGPSSVRFTFNCHRHWDALVIRAGDTTGHFLHIKKGVTQGDPLAMISYGLGILPLIRDLRAAQPRFTQP